MATSHLAVFLYVLNTVLKKKKETHFSNFRLVHFKRYLGARIQEAITINYFPEGNILDSGID